MADPRDPADPPESDPPDPPEPEPEPEPDPGADTDAWRAFAEEPVAHEEPAESDTSATTFRVLTLLAGLAAFGAIAWLLLQ